MGGGPGNDDDAGQHERDPWAEHGADQAQRDDVAEQLRCARVIAVCL